MAPINGPWTSARCELLPEGYIWEHTSLNSKTHLTLKPYYKSEYYNHHFPKRRGGSWETANKKRRENLKSPSGLFRPMPCLSPHLNQTLSSSNHQYSILARRDFSLCVRSTSSPLCLRYPPTPYSFFFSSSYPPSPSRVYLVNSIPSSKVTIRRL